MGFKRIDVRVTDEALSAIKKRAGSGGKSASKIVRELIESALAHPSGSGEVAILGRGPGMDLEMLKTAIGQERSEHEETQRELAEMGLLPDSPNGSGISPRIIKFQVEALMKTYELLRKMSLFLEPDEHSKRIEYVEKLAMEEGEKLILGGGK
jgi:hypothetical protein